MKMLIATTVIAATMMMSQGLNIRQQTGIVKTVDENGIAISTVDGNGWYNDSNPDHFSVGDKVSIIFDNMGTANVEDDEIISIKLVK